VDFDLGRSPTAMLARVKVLLPTSWRPEWWRPAAGPGHPTAALIRAHRAIHRDADVDVLRRAYDVAERMHRGQLRKSGEPYITHPLAVAHILAELGMDTTTLVAALLHDTVEDTTYTMVELRAEFGAELALLVDGVTKFDRVFYGDVAEVETIRKMIIAAGVDVRVLIVKLADRLHNMRTLEARSAASRARIALATREVLVPLCDRLGIQAVKRELEDHVLAVLEPPVYATLLAYVENRPEWTAYVERFIGLAAAAVRESGTRATVAARPRHLYSIWTDTYGRGHPAPDELPRVVIVVRGDETDCYTALGTVHGRWRPVPGRFKDFIASPKNNLYRSLHTTVIGPEEQPVEVLIRTETMHRNAEFGIVAAYRFARRRGPGAHSARARSRVRDPDGGEHLAWLRRLVEWQREAIDPVSFLESLRCDLAEGQLHVFVDGRRLLLPALSTPVDVAYAIGDEVGDRCVAATVNGQLAFLSSPLADGDVVEIHTAGPEEATGADGESIGPSREWLGFVRTPHARLQIRRWLDEYEESDPTDAPPVSIPMRVRIGRSAIALELRRRDRGLATEAPLVQLAAALGYPDLETLLVAVADHRLDAATVAERLIELVDGGAVASGAGAGVASGTPDGAAT
jgi:GTP pyrophosphokinase